MLRPVMTGAEPPPFKRNLVLPGVVTTALEFVLVVWPLFNLFGWSDE